jgi:AcrR family transcriptional regulator
MSTSRPKTKKGRMDVADRRALIVRVAATLFRERGYSSTTVREIAVEVGLSSGALFHHFNTKEDILLEVVAAGLQGCMATINAVLLTAKTPRERLHGMVQAHMSALLEGSPETKSVMFYEWWSLSTQARRKVVALRDRYEKTWASAIAEAQSSTASPADNRVKRLLLFGAMNWTTQWYKPEDGGKSISEITSDLMDLYFPKS